MNLSHLRAFQTVAELENMTRAANILHVAQPALSKTIAHLEEEFGVPLFDRQGRRLKLNPFGAVLLTRVRNVFDELDQARKELTDLANRQSGKVTVGVTTSQILPNIFEDYLARYPDIKFKLFQVSGRFEIARQLRDGALDLCISSLPIEQTSETMEMGWREILSEDIFLAVAQDHPLASRENVTLRELSGEKVISYTREDGFRQIIDHFCQGAGVSLNVVFESSDTSVIANLVRARAGVALLPAFWWDVAHTDRLVKLRITAPTMHRKIWLSWVKNRYMSPAVEHFREYITDYLRAK